VIHSRLVYMSSTTKLVYIPFPNDNVERTDPGIESVSKEGQWFNWSHWLNLIGPLTCFTIEPTWTGETQLVSLVIFLSINNKCNCYKGLFVRIYTTFKFILWGFREEKLITTWWGIISLKRRKFIVLRRWGECTKVNIYLLHGLNHVHL